MLVIMKLLILLLLGVQAIDLARTSLSLSSSPILPPYSYEFDIYGELYLCLTVGIGRCSNKFKTKWPLPDPTYESCIYTTFVVCLGSLETHENPLMIHIITYCLQTKCQPLLEKDILHKSTVYVSCLLECFHKHIASPSDVIYLQNS